MHYIPTTYSVLLQQLNWRTLNPIETPTKDSFSTAQKFQGEDCPVGTKTAGRHFFLPWTPLQIVFLLVNFWLGIQAASTKIGELFPQVVEIQGVSKRIGLLDIPFFFFYFNYSNDDHLTLIEKPSEQSISFCQNRLFLIGEN